MRKRVRGRVTLLHQQECDEARCPCCQRPLLMHLDIVVDDEGLPQINGVQIVHAEDPDGLSLQAALDQLPRDRA
jgi:hypothetical protein